MADGSSPTTVVGIDCAVDPRKVGIAIASFAGRRASIQKVSLGSSDGQIVDLVVETMRGSNKTLIALDAPLGWPRELGAALQEHAAGAHIPTQPNRLFRRETDRCVKERTGKQPLDVGADRIARTGCAALEFLRASAEKMESEIPLVWCPSYKERFGAIEVYPAATLEVYGFPSRQYKNPEQRERREEIVEKIGGVVDFDCDTALLKENADALDSAVCVLAGFDFLCDSCPPPQDPALAKKEGWIWVRESV